MSLESVIASPLIGIFALVGCVALIHRLGRLLLRVGLAAAEAGAVGGMVQVSARHGDLTGMAERRAHVSTVRRARTRALLSTALWTALLVAPALAGVSRPVYAAAALLWLLPRRPIRLTALAARPGGDQP